MKQMVVYVTMENEADPQEVLDAITDIKDVAGVVTYAREKGGPPIVVDAGEGLGD